MPWCEFGERQYELAANLELLAGSGQFFVPTTPAEANLAIDIALSPSDPRFWAALGVRPPRGVVARSSVPGWSAATTQDPPFLFSLFLQYKRSTHLTRASAREWGTHRQPYWRIELASTQHEKLQRLEMTVAADAVVRYAAPMFWPYQTMWQLQAAGAVLDHSVFISPGLTQAQHSYITWVTRHRVIGHSTPEELGGEDSSGLAKEISRRAERRPARADPRLHLQSLAASVIDFAPELGERVDWHRRAAEQLREREILDSDEAIRPLADITLIAEAAHLARADWVLLALGERDHRPE